MRRVSRRVRTAHHEAGHAVIGRVMGQVCGGATIVQNVQENEAGHAITVDPYLTWQYYDDLAMLTGSMGRVVSIRREIQQRLRAWQTKYSLPEADGDTADRRGTGNKIMLGRIVTFMAGAEVEEEFFGACAGGDGEDRRQISFMLDDMLPSDIDVASYAARLRRQARAIVRRHRNEIASVAALLLERRTVSAKEIDEAMQHQCNTTAETPQKN